MANSKLIYDAILSKFPANNLRMAFAYGSGAIQQTGHNSNMSQNMLDFIFVVDDSKQWHSDNISMNKDHYSFLQYLGPNRISQIQDLYGARLYFNTLVKCEDRMIKYGVISREHLINDLYDWESLYISGRLHKPVKTLLFRKDNILQAALNTNKQSAVHTALLLLPENFTEHTLYLTIAALSYNGDFRMKVGEDKNKVASLVDRNLVGFRDVYSEILRGDEHVEWNENAATLQQHIGYESQYHHLNLLPRQLQLGLTRTRNSDGRHRDTEEVIRSFAQQDREYKQIIESCLANIVSKSSVSQSLKGIMMAGMNKSMIYSFSKIKKMYKGGNLKSK